MTAFLIATTSIVKMSAPSTWAEGMQMKQQLMEYFQQSAYVKLAPSPIEGAGVGVLATNLEHRSHHRISAVDAIRS